MEGDDCVHAVALSRDNVLLYVKYSRPVSHVEVFSELRDAGVTIKDCIIEHGNGKAITDHILPYIDRWCIEEHDEPANPTSITVRSLRNGGLNYVSQIVGCTKSGKEFSVRPSEMFEDGKTMLS